MIAKIINFTSANEITTIKNIKRKEKKIYVGSLSLKTKSVKFTVVLPNNYNFPLFNRVDRCHGC